MKETKEVLAEMLKVLLNQYDEITKNSSRLEAMDRALRNLYPEYRQEVFVHGSNIDQTFAAQHEKSRKAIEVLKDKISSIPD